ncbi:MAG TPA: hypothetical protein VGE66_14295 [Chitinophagaceae bacterium]
MKPREELNSTDRAAIHEAGHVAACIILELEFDTVYLEPSKDHPGLVSKLVKRADIDYSSGVLTPEEEVLSTNLVITAFAGPACDAMHRGRATFDFTEYEDLDEVLDTIEYRFPNNNVRIAFTHYCEAEAFALFEDDRRLWRFTHVLARELSKQKKLTYAQVTDLYSKEYLVESWVRKEVDEIRRDGEVEKEDSLAANYEQRAASIEKAPKAQDSRQKGQEGRGRDRGGEGRGEQKPRDREAPKPAAAGPAVPEGDAQEGGADQQERRGRRRRRGRGRGRGKRREVIEQLPGEVIGEQPIPPAPEGEERSEKLPAPGSMPQGASDKPVVVKEGQQRQPVPVQKASPSRPEGKVEPGDKQPRPQLEPLPGEVINTKPFAAGTVGVQPQNLPVQGGEPPRPEERVKKQIIKAVKPPVPEEVPPAGQPAAEVPTPAVIPPAAEQRPARQPKAEEPRPVVPPQAAAQEVQPAEPPKRRLAVSGGPKAEGEAVSGGKGTTHPDSIWDEEKVQAPSRKQQAVKEKPQATSTKPQAGNDKPKAAGGEGKKPAKAATPRTAKRTPAGPANPAPVVKTPAQPGTKTAKAAVPKAPAAQKKAPAEPKPARTATKAAAPRTAKAAKTAAKTAQPKAAAPKAPVKAARKAPAKKAAPAKEVAATKKPAASKNAGGKKK